MFEIFCSRKLKKSSYHAHKALCDRYRPTFLASLASSRTAPTLTPGSSSCTQSTFLPYGLALTAPSAWNSFPLRHPNVLPIGNCKLSPHLVFPSHPEVFFSSVLIITWHILYWFADCLSSPKRGGSKKVSGSCASPVPRRAHRYSIHDYWKMKFPFLYCWNHQPKRFTLLFLIIRDPHSVR